MKLGFIIVGFVRVCFFCCLLVGCLFICCCLLLSLVVCWLLVVGCCVVVCVFLLLLLPPPPPLLLDVVVAVLLIVVLAVMVVHVFQVYFVFSIRNGFYLALHCRRLFLSPAKEADARKGKDSCLPLGQAPDGRGALSMCLLP